MAAATGLTVRTLHYYEQIGLLTAPAAHAKTVVIEELLQHARSSPAMRRQPRSR
ncbi:MAG: MerR family DNA-binding transcriptional regulator [Actinobacteria bacterium]|nr:MerR family DNA-binding transcriptional regulator [Actinomycetota bacterium]